MKINKIIKVVAAVVMAMTAGAAWALPTSYYSNQSKLSSGKWVKIKVTDTGMHEVTYSQLREWGFSNPSKVQVFGYPAAMLADNVLSAQKPDDLCQIYTYHYNRSGQEKLIFYGVGDIDARVVTNSTIAVNRNIYSDCSYYFLTDGASAITPTVNSYNSNESRIRISNHLKLEYHEVDKNNPVAAGAMFFDQNLMEGPQTISFPVPNFDSMSTYSPYLIYQFASDCMSSLSLQITPVTDLFTIRSTSTRPWSAPGYDAFCKFFYSNLKPFDVKYNSSSQAKTWDLTFSLPSSTSSMTFAALDYAAFIYPSRSTLSGMGQSLMIFPDAKSANNFSIENSSSLTQLWNVCDPLNISTYSKSYYSSTGMVVGSFDRNYNATTGPCRIMAFNPGSTMMQVEYAGVVPTQNIHGAPTPHMIIITPEALKPAADRLAEIHYQQQGLDVLVLTDTQVYNEFSSGTPAAMAYRRVAKMFFDRDPQKFRHLLLFGMGSWDNRHIIIPYNNHLLTYEAEQEEWARHPNRSYCADAYFGMMSEDLVVSNRRINLGVTNNPGYATNDLIYTPMDINVGRIPVNNISDAQLAVSKIEEYFNNPPIDGSYNRAVLLCDDGDENQFLALSEEVAAIANNTSQAFTINKLYNALYPFDELKRATMLRNALKMSLSKGQGFWGYVGHGRADMIGSHETLYTVSDIDNINYDVAPFTVLSTCDNLSFDRTADDIGGHLLRKVNGGAINIVAACRSVYKQYNEDIDMSVSKAYFTAKPGSTAGDIYRIGRNEVIAEALRLGDKYMATNTLCYNMGGDPAIPIFVPSLGVKTTAINGTEVDDSAPTNIYPLTEFTLTGVITDDEGNTVTDFTGVITADIYDGTIDVQSSTKGESKPDHTSLVHLDETLLTTATGTVTAGHFTIRVVSPVPIRPETANRISYYAARNDKKLFAAGVYHNLNIMTFDASKIDIDDTDAPEITEFYLNSPSFNSGDVTSADVTAYIEIAPDVSGLNVSDGKIGNGAKLILDGSTTYPYIASALSYNDDGSASIRFGLNELADGYHTLEFSICDNMGNRSSRLLGFTVVNSSVTATLAVAETPARTEANFTLDHNFNAEPSGRLVIEDTAGNTIYSRPDVTFPFTWDLRDKNGRTVDDGHYHAYVILNAGKQYSHTERVTVVVIK